MLDGSGICQEVSKLCVIAKADGVNINVSVVGPEIGFVVHCVDRRKGACGALAAQVGNPFVLVHFAIGQIRRLAVRRALGG
jgi:hypothetical protein